MPLYYGGAQVSSFPGATIFLSGQNTGHTPLSNQQDVRDSQQQFDFLRAANNVVFESCKELQLVLAGPTDLATQQSEQLEANSSISMQEFDYVVVIDFEATCDKNVANLKPQEIIEFPSILVDCRHLTLGDSFQTYVRPVHHPILTEFCTLLTGIQQEQVDKGMLLAEAIYLHDKWLEQNGIKGKNFAVLIWSDWDCKIMLDSECKLKGLDKPPYFDRWINLKTLFQGAFNGKKCNLRKSVEACGLKWMGRAHSGLDDARNTARLALELMRRGIILRVTGSIDSQEALVAEVRRPKWPGTAAAQQVPAATCKLLGTDGQSLNGCGSGDLAAQEIDTLQCFCGVSCKKHTVKKAGPTQGKFFFACGRWTPSEGSRCGFFEWAVGGD